MKWIECRVLREVTDTTDRLGNDITRLEEETIIKARLTPFSFEDMNIADRGEVTGSTRTLITPYKGDIEDKVIEVSSVRYKVIKVADLGKFQSVSMREMRIW